MNCIKRAPAAQIADTPKQVSAPPANLSGSRGGVTFPSFWNKGATDTYNNRIGRPAMIKMFYPDWALKAFHKNTRGGGQ